MLLIEQSYEDIIDGIESWDWIDFSEKSPFITTAFGDVFFESEDGIYFLDSLGGTLDKVSNTKAELQEILNTADGQDHYLMAGLVSVARESGLVLESGECYDFKVRPSLNGAMELDNLQKMEFKVSLNISGQLAKQIKDLPVGTSIGSVTLEGA